MYMYGVTLELQIPKSVSWFVTMKYEYERNERLYHSADKARLRHSYLTSLPNINKIWYICILYHRMYQDYQSTSHEDLRL